ncbi:Os11g0524051, partial [Oryza sativa Japonica Group]
MQGRSGYNTRYIHTFSPESASTTARAWSHRVVERRSRRSSSTPPTTTSAFSTAPRTTPPAPPPPPPPATPAPVSSPEPIGCSTANSRGRPWRRRGEVGG